MGGKVKQSQRTKNNVRPSSSGRSAVLLSNNITGDSSFGAVGTGLLQPTLFPTLVTTNIDQNLSPEYSICFKKFNKKDPITKTKALQELTELIKSSNMEDAVAALPSWASSYQTLTVESDKRVREAAQICHGAMMSTCGRRVAPQLRKLLPAWLLAQYDNHAPTSSLAQAQLTSTFPEVKLPEVLSFCKTEIISLLVDNLTGKTEAMFSKKIVDEDQLELQISRIVSSSLRSLEEFIMKLLEANNDWLWESLQPLLNANSFWKLAVHTSLNIRAAWYGLVGCIIQRYATRLPKELGVKTVRALFAQPERAAAVAAQRWAAVLLLMNNADDWHTWLDKKDLFIKRLLDVIENAGWGEARLLSNMLLPMLAKLPTELLNKEFYTTFFNAIFMGLDNKSILYSKSERQMWITLLAECLQYVSAQPNDYTIEVVTYVHRTWLEKILSMKDPTKNNLLKHSAATMATLTKFWLKQANQKEKYDQIIRNFWQNISSTILMQINNVPIEAADITRLLNDHILLLKTLNTSFNQEKRQLSIQFEDDGPGKVDVKPLDSTDRSLTERFKHNFDEVIERTCCYYFDFANTKQVSQTVFSTLITLLTDFDSKPLFMGIARHFKMDSIFHFYDNVLKTWLSGDTMRCKELADVVFLLLKYLNEEEQGYMFNTFQLFPPLVIEWCISLTLSHPHCSLPAGRRWMRSKVVEASVVALCKRDRARSLLLMCLAHDDNGEVMINESTVVKIIEIVSGDVDSKSEKVESATTLASQLVGALADTALQSHTAPLLIKLFTLNIHVYKGSNKLSINAWEEARSCWRDALAALPREARDSLVEQMLHIMHDFVFDNSEELDMNRIEQVAFLCPYLFISTKCYRDKNMDQLVTLTKQLFNIPSKQPQESLEVFALRCDCIFGNINCPFYKENEFIKKVADKPSDFEELDKSNIMTFVYNSLYKAFVLRAIMGKSEALADEDGADVVSWGDVLIKDDYFQVHLNKLFYDFAILDTLHKRYAFWLYFEIINESAQRMEELLKDILSTLSTESRKMLSLHFSKNATTQGYYWAQARRHLYEKSKEIADNEQTETLTVNEPKNVDLRYGDDSNEEVFEFADMKNINGSGFFHSLQINTGSIEKRMQMKYVMMTRSVLAAHEYNPELIRELAQGLEECQGGVIDAFINIYHRHNQVMLYESDLTETCWALIVSNGEILEYLDMLVQTRGWDMSSIQWDFTTITLCSLIASLRASAHSWGNTQVSLIANAVLPLFTSVQQFIANIRKEAEKRHPSKHVMNLISEWTNIFAPDINKHIFELLLIILRSGKESMTINQVTTIGSLIGATKSLQWELIPAVLRSGDLSLKSITSAATQILQDTVHHAYKYLAYAALDSVNKPLILEDAEKLAEWSSRAEDKEEPCPDISLEYFYEPLMHLQTIIEAALSSVEVCESTCVMAPQSQEHSVALGYMLLASALLRHSSLANKNLHHYYVEIFREAKYGKLFVSNAMRLLPSEALDCASNKGSMSASLLQCFTCAPELNVYESCNNKTIGSLACSVLTETLGGVGTADARSWVDTLDVWAAGAMHHLVKTAVTPVLLKRHLTQVRERADELPSTKVSIQWSRAEVMFTLEVDYHEVEMTLQFADTHPIVPPRIELSANSPLPETQWLVIYLTYQNGTLLNAAKMWIEAVNARVEGAPQCFICYAHLDPIFGRLPTLPCHQCHNLFHSPCLRKWFARNKTPSCPLCRTQF